MLPLIARRGGLLGEKSERKNLWLASGLNAVRLLLFVMAYKLTAIGLGLVYRFSVGLVGFGLFFVGMKCLHLFQYSALAYSEVPIGAALGVLVLGEGFALNQIAGAVMILGASFIAQTLRTKSPVTESA